MLADGDSVAGMDYLRQIAVERVVGESAKHLLASLRDGQIQNLGRLLGILVINLVEVIDAEDEKSIGMFFSSCL